MRPKKIKDLLLFFSILTLLFSFVRPADAIIGTGIFDYFSASMGGIEEFSKFSTKYFQSMLGLLVVSLILLGLSAYFLQWIISIPIEVMSNTVVLTGWRFTLGLTNMFFILIFIVIALAFVLKIETIAQRKILVNLILIALLINFSLLFVGALADVATFFKNTILGDNNEELAFLAIGGLMEGLGGLIQSLSVWLVGYLALYAIPFSGPFAQYALALKSLILIMFAPTFLTWIVTAFVALGVAGIFFTYFFLFTCRIFVIWALAILAPLAFACHILPGTKKWWDLWLKNLFEWIFLGIILLLWLVLGLRLIPSLTPGGGPTFVPIFSWWPSWLSFQPFFQRYMFLFVYLVIGIFIEKTTAPALAGLLISQGKELGQAMWTTAIKPLGTQLQKAWGKEIRKQLVESEEWRERGKKWAEAPRPELKTWRGVPKAMVMGPAWALRRELGRRISAVPLEETRRGVRRVQQEADKILEPSLMSLRIEEARDSGDVVTEIGLVTKSIEKGGAFKKKIEEKFKGRDQDVIRMAQHANRAGLSREAERIARTFVHLAPHMNFPDLSDSDEAKGYKTIQDKLVGEAKGDQIKELQGDFWTESPDAMEAVLKFWGGSRLRKATDEFGRSFVEAYMAEVTKKGIKWLLDNNQSALLFLSGNAAQDLGFRSPEGLSRSDIRELISKYKKPGGPSVSPPGVV